MSINNAGRSAPSYLALYSSGELEKRVKDLWSGLSSCHICPRHCGINRLAGETGFCGTGALPLVASACIHHGEEPPISGTRGSGTIFFGSCNLRCVYCQNHQISQDRRRLRSEEVEIDALADKMLGLQVQGCHNINFVSPSHFVPQIAAAVLATVPKGLDIPLVYNTSGYDNPSTVEVLDGIIDIYLADLRYSSGATAKKLSQAGDYVEYAREAIKEMHRQVGPLIVDEEGVARKGLIVRHLILPNGLAGSRDSLTWLAQELGRDVAVSIMAQYSPQHLAKRVPLLSRSVTAGEYEEVLGLLDELGLENGWVQDLAASEEYIPDFDRKHPFAPSASG